MADRSHQRAAWVIELGDGRRVVMRRARPGDEPALVSLYQGLSMASRHLRFAQATPRLTGQLRRAVTDLGAGPVWLAVAGGACVGEARLVPARSGEVHLAMAVADRFQRQGLGRQLGRLLLADPDGGHRDVMITMVASHQVAVRLAREAGFLLRPQGGLVEGRLSRAPVTRRSRLVGAPGPARAPVGISPPADRPIARSARSRGL